MPSLHWVWPIAILPPASTPSVEPSGALPPAPPPTCPPAPLRPPSRDPLSPPAPPPTPDLMVLLQPTPAIASAGVISRAANRDACAIETFMEAPSVGRHTRPPVT